MLFRTCGVVALVMAPSMLVALAACGDPEADATGGTWQDAPVMAGHRVIDAKIADNGDLFLLTYDQEQIFARRREAATGEWTPLRPLWFAAEAKLAVDARGDAMVVGHVAAGLVARRFDAAAGWANGWLPLEDLSQGAEELQLVAAGGGAPGRFAVCWIETPTTAPGARVPRFRARRLDPGTGWSESVGPELPTTFSVYEGLAAMAERDGTWRLATVGAVDRVEGGRGFRDAEIAELTWVGGKNTWQWSGPQSLGFDADASAMPLSVTIDRGGGVDVLLTTSVATLPLYLDLVVVRRSGIERSTTAVAQGALGGATMTTGDDGSALVAWSECEGRCRVLARRREDARWRSPETFDADTGATSSVVSLAGSGTRTLVAWGELSRPGVSASGDIRVHAYAGGGLGPVAGSGEIDAAAFDPRTIVAYREGFGGFASWAEFVGRDANDTLTYDAHGMLYLDR